VASPEAVVSAVYDILSGSATDERDWTRFRSLYAPNARLVAATRDADDRSVVDMFSVDEYIASLRPILASADFHEREVAQCVDRHGHVAHVRTDYEMSRNPLEPAFHQGAASIQAVLVGGRWWILHEIWDPGADRLSAPASATQNGTSPSPDTLLRTVYGVLSGPARQPRDWSRFRAVHTPDARLVPVGRAADGDAGVEILTVDGYITSRQAILASGDFFERELSCRVDQHGCTAHVLSHYEAARTPDGPAFRRGLNSFQFVRDRGRWRILHGIWDAYASELG
jgi:hypothetical protein